MHRAIEFKRKIVFADETIFSRYTMMDRAWTAKKTYAAVDNAACEMVRTNLIMAVAEGMGVVAWVMTRDSLNTTKYTELLRQIAERVPKAAVLQDNASYHRSNRALMESGKTNLYPIFNVPHTPQLNPIE